MLTISVKFNDDYHPIVFDEPKHNDADSLLKYTDRTIIAVMNSIPEQWIRSATFDYVVGKVFREVYDWCLRNRIDNKYTRDAKEGLRGLNDDSPFAFVDLYEACDGKILRL